MLVVGLTGGIGSGKSTVAKMFEKFNIPIYYADNEAKQLMNRSKIIRRKLTKRFGDKVYLKKELNRPYLASKIFNDKDALQFVSEVVHPKVAQHFKRWIKKQNSPYIIQENAILFENGSYKNFDKIITVTAPLEIRIKRVIKRDQTTKKQILERINNQLPDADKIQKSDFVINNTQLDKTQKQVADIHKKLVELNHF